MNTAIIAAAGGGTRFRTQIPKQFVELAGRAIIARALDRFEECAAVDEIVLVLSADGTERFDRQIGREAFSKLKHVVVGGETRFASVKRGLAVIGEASVVAVHDGARPLVTADEIRRTIEKAAETGAACLVAEVTDTIKTVDDDGIVGTLDRRALRRALTPQAFTYEIITNAFDQADLEVDFTDECMLVESLGIRIAMVEGSNRNIKITRPADLIIAEAILNDV